jgi:hypothetical protein
MNQAWINSLISAGAGLLGALLGALLGVWSTLRASRRASQTAFKQVRFAAQHQHSMQVMTTAYDMVGTGRDKLASAARSSSTARFQEKIDAFWDQLRDTHAYLNRNVVWLDVEVLKKLRSFQRTLESLSKDLEQIWKDESAAGDERQENIDKLAKRVSSKEMARLQLAIGQHIQEILVRDMP